MTVARAEPVPGTPISLRGLTVRLGDRLLLEKATARFEPGQITLIVGPSGAGKSTLLRVLAGLNEDGAAGPEVSGSVTFGDGAADIQPAPSVGVVFQQFALFDELSPLDNVRFALAHQPKNASNGTPEPEALLAELHVPSDVPTGALSGGQQQRLAIARTLAYHPPVILYDEPTSGLDMATADQVAHLIRRTQDAHPCTSIVVTHDVDTLRPVADRIYLLDPTQHSLREIPRDQWGEVGSTMHSLAERQPHAGQPARWKTPGIGERASLLVTVIVAFLVGTTSILEQLLALPLRLVPIWRSPHWGLRFCLHYLRLVAGPLAMLYVVIAGVVVGFVATYFTFRFLPYRTITEPLVEENVLQALGFLLFRVLVPVLITVLVAARCGAAVTSDVGGKVYGRQVDALRTLGARPARYLLTPILYAFLVGTPFLVVLAFLAARFTSLCVFVSIHPEQGAYFWHVHFQRELVADGQWLYRGTGWLMVKLLCCGVGMALLAYGVGMRPKHSASDVSHGITLHILLATIYVLLVHLVFALFEFD